MIDRLRRMRTGGQGALAGPHLSFGGWEALDAGSVVQVCHPDWRGVRVATYAFGTPVVECVDLGVWGDQIAEELALRGPSCVVVQGWPPGAASFVRRLAHLGIRVKCVLHSAPTQHGAEPGEAAVADEVLGLAAEGVIAAVGMVKSGVSEAFRAIGHPVEHVPNRVPVINGHDKVDLGPGFNVGIFAEPFWRKNVTTQLLAVALIDGGRAHVMAKPVNRYLDGLEIVEHGELPYAEFIALQGSVDLNLYVTLSECHPLTPQESYLTGVPCLTSRTSAVFQDDPVLWELTTVELPDNPAAIAAAAIALYQRRDEAIERATNWMLVADREAARRWTEFVGRR